MLVSLVTLPIRITRRSAEVAWQTSQAIVERAIGLVGEVIMPTAPEREHRPDDHEQRRSTRAEEPDSEQIPHDPRSAADPGAVQELEALEPEPPEPQPEAPEASPPAPPEPEPEHISEEVTLVEAVAEPGAEDGAGAEVHVAEPWEGYKELKAADVIDRIKGASATELAAVELYELTHRKRQSVIEVAQSELRRAQNAS